MLRYLPTYRNWIVQGKAARKGNYWDSQYEKGDRKPKRELLRRASVEGSTKLKQ